MAAKPYYCAYDGRYRAIHAVGYTWAASSPTPMILPLVQQGGFSKNLPMLEIGCGEGRDSIALLEAGYNLLCTDVSTEAIRYCQKVYPAYADRFQVMDACRDRLDQRFGFIFATAVLHMLVEDEHRQALLRCIRDHLTADGLGLILSMGDGQQETATDPSAAFDIQRRTNNAHHVPVEVPVTSCRMVSFDTLRREIGQAGLAVVDMGLTESLPDFNSLIAAQVRRCSS